MTRPLATSVPTGGHIVSFYEGSRGWSAAPKGLELAPRSAAELRARGYEAIRVRTGWWKIETVSIERYLEMHPFVTGGRRTAVEVRYSRRGSL